jgi:hypothetical protein
MLSDTLDDATVVFVDSDARACISVAHCPPCFDANRCFGAGSSMPARTNTDSHVCCTDPPDKQPTAQCQQFVITLAENPMRSARHFDPREYSHALSVIGNLVKKKPVQLLPELPRLVEAVVHSLDPNVPSLRDSCMKAATSVLHSIVSKVRLCDDLLSTPKSWCLQAIHVVPNDLVPPRDAATRCWHQSRKVCL